MNINSFSARFISLWLCFSVCSNATAGEAEATSEGKVIADILIESSLELHKNGPSEAAPVKVLKAVKGNLFQEYLRITGEFIVNLVGFSQEIDTTVEETVEASKQRTKADQANAMKAALEARDARRNRK